MKRDAALDTSFWINAYRAELYQYLPNFFDVAYCSRVRDEIEQPDPRHPSIVYPDTQAFRVFCQGGLLQHRDPKHYETIFGAGESQALALAKQEGRLLLIDDLAPHAYASNILGLQVVDSASFLMLLYAERMVSLKGALSRLERLERGISKQLLIPVRRTIELMAERRKEKRHE